MTNHECQQWWHELASLVQRETVRTRLESTQTVREEAGREGAKTNLFNLSRKNLDYLSWRKIVGGSSFVKNVPVRGSVHGTRSHLRSKQCRYKRHSSHSDAFQLRICRIQVHCACRPVETITGLLNGSERFSILEVAVGEGICCLHTNCIYFESFI